MKTTYKLKSASAACVHAFHYGDFSGYEAIKQHNDSILSDVYKRIQFGLSDYAYINTGDARGGLIYIISRDTVYNNAVRVSVFYRAADGGIYATSHKTLARVKDLLNYCLPSGRLFVVGGWYDKLLRGA